MARVLVIYAHPKTPAHNPLILGEVKRQLEKAEAEYDLIDLYADGFDPVLHEEEHYTSGRKKVSAQAKKYQGMVQKAHRIIVIHAVWWNGAPAVLRGFYEKVLTNHFAFRYVPMPFPFLGLTYRPVGLLRGKKACVFLTSGGPSWVTRVVMGNRAALVETRDTWGFCGVKAKSFLLGGASSPVDAKKKRRIECLVSRGLSWLF